MHYLLGTALTTATVVAIVLLAIHLGFRAPRRVERGSPADLGLTYEAVSIPTVDGKRLFAWWLPGANDAAPTVVLMHGWGGNAELMLPLAKPLHAAGLNVLLPDARNHGRSDATSFSSMPRFAEDVGAAITWLHTRTVPPPAIVLLGHSVGAAAVLLEAARRHDIAAVISIAAFAHPDWMMRRQLARLRLPGPLIDAVLRYVEWVIGHRYDDIAPLNTVRRVDCPVLLVHGKADDTVPATDALAIRGNPGSEQVELLLLDGAGHNSVDLIERHADRLLTFLQRAGVVQ
ncbi:MAG: alpha/beta hydrolase [Gammaproteobacteria bacterium]|nr:alpha/beta hydrolase [Gammaproteobacteria bacterium]